MRFNPRALAYEMHSRLYNPPSLAKRTREVDADGKGLSERSIRKYLSGDAGELRPRTIRLVAEALGVDPNAIIMLTEKDEWAKGVR